MRLFTLKILLGLVFLLPIGCGSDGTDTPPDPDPSNNQEEQEENDAVSLTRGTWFWAGAEQDSSNFIDSFTDYQIGRAYGAYQERPVTEADAIATWNQQLAAAGIDSYYLMSETVWVCDWSGFLEKVQERFIDFNQSRNDPTERFVGLHLDIEPHALDGTRSSCPYDWSVLSIAEKQELLENLRDLLADTRDLLDENGLEGITLYAALPVWYDNAGGQSFSWDSETERDAWFASLDESLTGISLMAYCRETLASIESGVDWEIENFSGEVWVGLNVAEIIGSDNECQTWDDAAAMLSMAEQLESALIGEGVDIQSFSQLVDLAQ